ncbi:flavodoxin [Eubacteriales bacterium OttesenSCG-928-N13]|nr:flavodoxin [Eubacteriales bacterium OttesenSCG-928-N13]
MGKIAIVYWSGTGNTLAMAEAVLAGVQKKGGQGTLLASADFTADMIASYDAFALGCPSMGAEVLEESEFEPMFSSCKAGLAGKKVVLFGSYGWGDGEWMRNWEAECAEEGITLAAPSVICNDSPDDEAIDSCMELGAALL